MAKVTPKAEKAEKSPASGTAVASTEPKKEKTKRIPHPLVGTKDQGYPFDTVPPDFDPKLHKPLKKTDFKSAAGFLDYTASKIELRAQKLMELAKKKREEADTERKFPGGSEKAKAAKKKAKLLAQLAELEKQLAEDGTNA